MVLKRLFLDTYLDVIWIKKQFTFLTIIIASITNQIFGLKTKKILEFDVGRISESWYHMQKTILHKS